MTKHIRAEIDSNGIYSVVVAAVREDATTEQIGEMVRDWAYGTGAKATWHSVGKPYNVTVEDWTK